MLNSQHHLEITGILYSLRSTLIFTSMRLSFYLFLSLLLAGCYAPNQTVWQNGPNVRPLNRSAFPRPALPRPGTPPPADIGNIPTKPGACYAKSKIQAKTLNELLAILPLYTGSSTENDIELDTVSYEVQAASTKWVKKKSNKNCHSPNPEDCLVWCLVEQESIVKPFIIVKDTSRTKQFEMTKIYSEAVDPSGEYTAWVEVICETNMTEQLTKDVQGFLYLENYLSGNITGKFNEETKSALIKYQEQNNLPIGQLDFETLDSMNINY